MSLWLCVVAPHECHGPDSGPAEGSDDSDFAEEAAAASEDRGDRK